MVSTRSKHLVAHTMQAWGHARPLVNFCARLTKLQSDIYVTVLTTDAFFDRMVKELSRSYDPGEEGCAERIRVISLGDRGDMGLPQGDDVKFENMWKTLIAGDAPVCARTGVIHAALPKPQAVFLDIFVIDDANTVKALSGDSVKAYTLYPGMLYAILALFGPEHLGGRGNVRVKAEEEARCTGRTFKEVVIEMAYQARGEIFRLPGMPPMYDYEHLPQDFPIIEEIAVQIFPRAREALDLLDGALLITPESYEPGAVAACRAWYAETGRPVIAAGPLFPPASKATASANEMKQSTEAAEIQAFLDETLRTHGEKSLLYISFGTIFWPVKTPEKLWAFLDVVMELNLPFILSHASPMAVVPDEVKDKVKAYGKGIVSPWTPQQLILDHPATGWYVAHGGHNGLTEAIGSGVPMIVWPFSADQPLNAIMVTDVHNIGYELLEVRSGNGLRPIYRTGYTPVGTVEAVKAEARDVLTKAFGEDGVEKRERLEGLRQAVLSEWEEGGAALRDARIFLSTLTA